MGEDLWEAYLATVIDVCLPDGRTRRLEQRPPTAPPDWPFAEPHAWIMTACNPRSTPLTGDENAERHVQFGRQLSVLGHRAWPNVGFDPKDPTWSEPGYTIPGITEGQVRRLAEEWEQNAVFGWWPDRWELVGILLPGRTVTSWRWAESDATRGATGASADAYSS